MQYIEMMGCPGCGKSTLFRKTKELLQQENLIVLGLRDVFFYHRRDGKKGRLIARIFMDFLNYPVYLSALLFTLKHGKRLSSWKYLGSFLFLYYELNYVMKHETVDVLLFDEGIIQYLSSIPHDRLLSKNISDEKILKRYIEDRINPRIIDCRLTMEENIRRIRDRKADTRFSRIKNDEILISIMNVKRCNLDRLSGGFFKELILNMNDDIRENAIKVAELILNRK